MSNGTSLSRRRYRSPVFFYRALVISFVGWSLFSLSAHLSLTFFYHAPSNSSLQQWLPGVLKGTGEAYEPLWICFQTLSRVTGLLRWAVYLSFIAWIARVTFNLYALPDPPKWSFPAWTVFLAAFPFINLLTSFLYLPRLFRHLQPVDGRGRVSLLGILLKCLLMNVCAFFYLEFLMLVRRRQINEESLQDNLFWISMIGLLFFGFGYGLISMSRSLTLLQVQKRNQQIGSSRDRMCVHCGESFAEAFLRCPVCGAIRETGFSPRSREPSSG